MKQDTFIIFIRNLL